MSKVTVRVDREHANSGDCRVHVTVPGAETIAPFHIPGDVTAFTALRMLAPWLESKLNPQVPDEEPMPATEPEVTP